MFGRSGEIGRDLLKVDWSATPLGDPDHWPASLASAVRIVLTSRFSMWMLWGPDKTFFCNEAYRRDTLGTKYPWALGRPSAEVWSEIWDEVLPRIEHVMGTGEATWDESLMLFLERSGYREETYHTFSYSPLHDDAGAVAGMLCVVSEDTEGFVASRRLRTLRDLGSRRAVNLTVEESVTAACDELAHNPQDLPFSLVYLFDGTDGDSAAARRVGSTGFAGEHPAAPAEVVVAQVADVWPAADALEGRTTLVDRLPERHPDLPTGAWDVPPDQALVVPMAAGPGATPYGFLVAGLNRHRPLDERYRDFLDLLAAQLAATITDARAYEFERSRAETLAELDQAKTDFFTNVSHEFRTPLTLMLGPAEDALADEVEPLPDRQRGRVEVVLRNGQRLLKLVNTLLDFSRLESGRVEARFEPVELDVYTRELASMFASAAERLGLSLTIETEPLPQPVHVDRDLWAKVVLNLLSNALKFTFEGGITVRVSPAARGADVLVSDTGTGIPDHELPHLFDRFHRVTGARSRSHEGSGIGLALVSELVELHGGAVAVSSTLGSGSTFRMHLPYGVAHLPAEQVAEPRNGGSATVTAVAEGFLAETAHWADSETRGSAAERRPLTARSGTVDAPRPRVLVVDDNADIREYVAQLLGDDHDVLTAVDGVDAMEQARELQPDLVLTDVMMPRMDGFELVSALRLDPVTVGIPVVMLSARGGEEGTLQGLESGADDYLVKPFTARELQARVRANLELDRARRIRRQLERSQALLDQAQRLAHVGSWELDLTSRKVSYSDEYLRIMARTRDELDAMLYEELVDLLVHPDDRDAVMTAMAAGGEDGFSYETRIVRPGGDTVLVAVHAELVADEEGRPRALRGTMQDVTERRAAEEALAVAAANAEAAAREHAIADQLQRSLMPQTSFLLEHLDVSTYYRAGIEGTQVGGDWYDVIDLGGGRTALVVGDVMGRGVAAAAVMGQLRSAVRAYARLDLPPADVLEQLDGLVRDLGEDQIVTCVYAVFDPADQCLRFANAGHLPPVLMDPDGSCSVVEREENPPLGLGPFNLSQHELDLSSDSRVVLYTDGLVERRGEDLEKGIARLVEQVCALVGPIEGVPEALVSQMLPDGPDDDIAILLARVDPPTGTPTLARRLEGSEEAVADARHLVSTYLRDAGLPAPLVHDAVLVTSELVTNAVLHGALPVDLRVRTEGPDLFIEVRDHAPYQPRKMRPDADDEHGRGIQIVSTLAARWGTRLTEDGKAVWCVLSAAP